MKLFSPDNLYQEKIMGITVISIELTLANNVSHVSQASQSNVNSWDALQYKNEMCPKRPVDVFQYSWPKSSIKIRLYSSGSE
jgi:hypothetical protein